MAESPEDEYRRLKGYPRDYPVPISLESPTLPRDEGRNLDLRRYEELDAALPKSTQPMRAGQPVDGMAEDAGRFDAVLQSRFDAGAPIDELHQLAAAHGRELRGLDAAVNYRDRGGKGARFVSSAPPSTMEGPPEMSMLDAARKGIGVVQSGLDAATLGAAATGVGEPIAGALTLVNDGLEIGLGGLNAYDWLANGNSDPFLAQVAAAPIRFLPAGRLLQKGLVEARGATGILRDGAGRFRPSYLKHDVVKEAAQQAAEVAGGGLAESVFPGDNRRR